MENNEIVKKKDNKKLVTIIIILICILLSIGCYFAYNKFIINHNIENSKNENLDNNNNDENKETNQDKLAHDFYAISYRYDSDNSGSLIGINDKGEITPIFSYLKFGFKNFDIYGNYLYYIYTGDLYKIDLTKKPYNSIKMFAVSPIFDLIASKDIVYVMGPVSSIDNASKIYSYNLSTGKSKLIISNENNSEILNDDYNILFYTKKTDNGLYAYNLLNNSESLIKKKARVLYGSKTKLYLQTGSASEVNEDYIYDLSTKSLAKFNGSLEPAVEYANKIIYIDNMKVMSSTYNSEKETIYDFKNLGDEIGNIVLLNNNLLVVVKTFRTDLVDDTGYNYSYYILNMETKTINKLAEDYHFLEYSVDYVTVKR